MDLVLVNDEVLAQRGEAGGVARLPEMVEAPLKEPLIGQDTERGGSGGLVLGGDPRRLEALFADHPG